MITDICEIVFKIIFLFLIFQIAEFVCIFFLFKVFYVLC
jgi:hypothetical protein